MARNKVVNVYFSEEEFKIIRTVAFKRRRKVAEIIRSEIVDILEPEYLKFTEELNGKNNGHKNH